MTPYNPLKGVIGSYRVYRVIYIYMYIYIYIYIGFRAFKEVIGIYRV